VQQAILELPEPAWQPAVDPDGRPRRGAWVAELAPLDLAGVGWPQGTRVICRRERPHPGAVAAYLLRERHDSRAVDGGEGH
jgi:hypothetical protein